MALYIKAALDHYFDHLGAQILIMVGRRYREITFLVTRTISEVVLFPTRVPTAFFGVDKVETRVMILIEPDVIEDKKIGFSDKIRRIGDSAVIQE